MLLAVVLITGFFMLSMRSRALVPGRLQSMAEVGLRIRRQTCCARAPGTAGMKYLPPRVHALHVHLPCNMLGMIPGFFTVTSHIIVTAALARWCF